MSSPHDSSANNDPDPAHAGSNPPLITTLFSSASFPACGGWEPLVDQRVLYELEEDFNGPAAVHDFARNFIQSWEGKYQRLAASVHHRDQERAQEAVLSVKVTSIMVGASRLAHLAAQLEELIENNDMASATEALTGLGRCGSDTRTELLVTYIR